MRSCAEVCKLALLIEGYFLTLRDSVDEQYLIRLALFFHEFLCFIAGKCETFYFEVFLDYLFHFGFDFFKLLCRKCHVGVEIVIEAIINSGPDCELDFGIKTLYSLRKNMRGCMEECLFAALIFEGKQFYVISVMNGGRELVCLAVYFRRDYFAGNGNSCRLCRVINGKSVFNTVIFAVDSDVHCFCILSKINIRKNKNPHTSAIGNMRCIARFHSKF